MIQNINFHIHSMNFYISLTFAMLLMFFRIKSTPVNIVVSLQSVIP